MVEDESFPLGYRKEVHTLIDTQPPLFRSQRKFAHHILNIHRTNKQACKIAEDLLAHVRRVTKARKRREKDDFPQVKKVEVSNHGKR
jgi:hypothetical protein